MNEVEEKTESELFALIDKAGKYLTVGLIDRQQRDDKRSTDAFLDYDKVNLILVKSDPIEMWIDAILKAEELCGKLEDKRGWERQNPILFERITARLRHLGLLSVCH